MSITLLFFAVVRELVGRREEIVSLPDDVRTVGELAQWLEAREPALRGNMSQVRIARNEAFVEADEALADGDTIALIPPVAGG